MTIRYSVVLPIFNEEACLPQVLDEIQAILSDLGGSFEIICVDDCSRDQTWSIIKEYNLKNANIKGIRFLRNFGHQLAILAGIKYSTGDYVAVMDSDGQDPPSLLPQLFKKCEEGYHVVYAIRQKRKESIFKKAAYLAFYRIFRLVIPFNVPLDAGDFAVFTRDVANFISQLKEKNPFIRGLRSWYGGKQIGINYDRPQRIGGESKYSLSKLFRLAVNGTISFSKLPLRIITILGFVVSFLSFLIGIYLVILKLTVGVYLVGWTSIALLIIFFGGINLIVVGIIGEYIGEIFDDIKSRPTFMVDQFVGMELPEHPA